MAISPACHNEEEQIMSLRNRNLLVENNAAADDDDGGLEEDLKALRARVAALQDVDVILFPESWDWAKGVEAVAQRAAKAMAEEEEDIQRALSSMLSSSHRRCGEELSLAAALGEQAARVDAEEVAAATRRLRETDLRRLAADTEMGYYHSFK